MGYSALIDWGATLVALGLGTPDGAAVAAMAITVRVLALVVWGVGAGVLVGALGAGEQLRHLLNSQLEAIYSEKRAINAIKPLLELDILIFEVTRDGDIVWQLQMTDMLTAIEERPSQAFYKAQRISLTTQ